VPDPLIDAVRAGDLAAVQRLVAAGADVQIAGKWWEPGFYTREIPQEVARFLVDRGAPLSVHAAAGFGFIDRIDPAQVHAKGGDGCTPLHFARNVETAKFLIEHGANVDARDEDHDSTPAQWLIGGAPEVVRFLLEHGAKPDIFLAAALGDQRLAERLIAADRSCLASRIGKLPEFPPLGHQSRGGTIYQWTLAFNSYPHQIALKKGHQDLFDFLYDHSDTPTRLLVSCVLARRAEAETIVAQNPGLVQSLPPVDHELVARYCWETNTNYEAVKLMLDVGFPVSHPERSHGYSPLHNAAWAGSADLVDLLISRGHPVDLVDPHYNATPFGFAMYDLKVEKRHPEGQFARVFESLLKAGSPWDPSQYPTGDSSVDEVLKARLS
jgi:ankyrin repeat protein